MATSNYTWYRPPGSQKLRASQLKGGITTQSPTDFGGLQVQKDKQGNVLQSGSDSQGYAQIPDYMDLAKQYLPSPSPLGSLSGMPEYAKTQVGTDIQNTPEYSKAFSWDLPNAPKFQKASYIDPQAYENQWKLSSDALRKSFYDPGGYNEQGVNSILERGLGTSGDKGRVMGDVAGKYAEALANARLGLDTSRMQGEADINLQNTQAENALNQYLFGAGASRNQSVADAARSLLGARLGQEQFNAGQNMNLLGMNSQREIYNNSLPLQTGQAQLAAATGLAGAQNETISNQWAQQYQEAQAEMQKQLQAQQAAEQERQQRMDELMSILGNVNLSDEEERALVQQWASQSGSPVAGFGSITPSPAPVDSSPSWSTGNPNQAGYGMNQPPYPGTFIGQQVKVGPVTWVWSGAGWNKNGMAL